MLEKLTIAKSWCQLMQAPQYILDSLSDVMAEVEEIAKQLEALKTKKEPKAKKEAAGD